MKIQLGQINTKVADFENNFQKAKAMILATTADLVIFPECTLPGYPPQDLLEYSSFSETAERYAARLVAECPRNSFIFGSIERNRDAGKPYRNVAIFADQGEVKKKYMKRLLPTYDVFDEERFFEPGREACVLDFKNRKIALTICEDLWRNYPGAKLHNRYSQDPLAELGDADLLINLSASPFEFQKLAAKKSMLEAIAKQHRLEIVYVNLVGANDSIIFDGRSLWISKDGVIQRQGKGFEEDSSIWDLAHLTASQNSSTSFSGPDVCEIYDALILGIRDYCFKSDFKSVILGLSGGVDSSVVACLASDALGAANTHVVMMPSRFTSASSNLDALQIAKNMQNPLYIYSIEEIYESYLHTLETAFRGLAPNLTEENLQSRIRGSLLMALSNKLGHLLLSCGNKSELAVGYCTLYGDTNGGLAPLSDIYKTQVYELAHEANRRSQRIPESVFLKAPSAELRANQKDQDSLPPYDLLDRILEQRVEKFSSREDLLQQGFAVESVDFVLKALRQNEFKRSQMPLGLKVSSKAFGVGRRIPIVQSLF